MTTKPLDTPETEDRYRKNLQWDSVTWATHCVDCYPGNCPYRVYVKDGIVVGEEQAGTMPVIEEGVPDMNPMGCQKGAAWSQLLYAPERVLHPLKRAGERGEGKWTAGLLGPGADGDRRPHPRRHRGGRAGVDHQRGHAGRGRPADRVHVLAPDRPAGRTWRRTSTPTINDFSPGIYLTFGKFDPASSIDDMFHAEFIMYTHMQPGVHA